MEQHTTPHIVESFDYLYEQVEEDINCDFEKYQTLINELSDTGYIEVLLVDDDRIKYKARSGLTWAKVVEIADPIKKKILIQLIENPQCFFVLFNTQRGKLRIIGYKLAGWSQMSDKRVVGYLVVDNDRTLSEQSVNGLFHCFPIRPGHEHEEDPAQKYNVEIFELSSNNKVSLSRIITYIDAYAYNPHYRMPLIVVLSNNKQIEKLIRILCHIKNHTCRNLCAAGGWDEADKTYPPFRNRKFGIGGQQISFLDLLSDPEERTILQNGFVTATEGQLIEEEYEECANAYHFIPETDPADAENYFAFHHPECIKHNVSVRGRESNNVIAERVLRDNWESHFAIPLTLRDGSDYHHKVIINADVKADDMRDFALKFKDIANVITFNMRGLNLYRASGQPKSYRIKKRNLNSLLFYIYKMNKLENKPLIIIGRRKVDRGLGFHYAPRGKGTKILEIMGEDGTLTTDGKEGLIWTDMIMGNKIEHIPTAVQKAGRGAGIIRQCPQYPGEFHYWIDSITASFINHHYKVVDKTIELPGANSILQAVSHAKSIVHLVRQHHDVDLKTFRVIKGTSVEHTLELTKQIITQILGKRYRAPTKSEDEPDKYSTSLNNESVIARLLDAVKKVPGAYGTNANKMTYRRFFACYSDTSDANTLHCVIPLSRDPSYTEEMRNRIDAEFGQYLVKVPQTDE